MPRLTKRLVDSLQPGPARSFTWDEDVAGFCVSVSPNGRKTFILKYRVGGGRTAPQRRYSLGVYGTLTVDQARDLARSALARVTLGEDPAADRAEYRASAGDTLRAFGDIYLERHADAHKKASSAKEDRRLLSKHVLPTLGDLRMRDMTTADVVRLTHTLRGTPILANRVRALLSKMFSTARLWRFIPAGTLNPVTDVPRYPEGRRQRFLSSAELQALGKALADAERDAAEPWQAIAAVRLLIFTGCRKSEILELEWKWVDFDNALLSLPASKTGAKVVYLAPPALKVLASLPRPEGGRYVLPSVRGDGPFVGVFHVWQRLAKSAGIAGTRLHDLRHSYASQGAALGTGLPIIGALLGHRETSTTARYAHLAADPVRQAGARIAGALAGALSGETAKVVRLAPNKGGRRRSRAG